MTFVLMVNGNPLLIYNLTGTLYADALHADVNKRCIDFNATPLFWAIHGLKSNGAKNKLAYLQCVKLLLRAGADKNIPNKDGKTAFDLLTNADDQLKTLLQ